MNSMVKEYIASFVRNLLAPVVVYLAATGYISQSEAANLVIAVVTVIVAVVWGLVNKFLWKQTVASAIEVPGPVTEKKLSDVINGN